MYATLHNASANLPLFQDVTIHESKEDALNVASDATYKQDLHMGEQMGSIVFDLHTPQDDDVTPADISHAVLINTDVDGLEFNQKRNIGPWTEIYGYGSSNEVSDAHPGAVDSQIGNPSPSSILYGVIFDTDN